MEEIHRLDVIRYQLSRRTLLAGAALSASFWVLGATSTACGRCERCTAQRDGPHWPVAAASNATATTTKSATTTLVSGARVTESVHTVELVQVTVSLTSQTTTYSQTTTPATTPSSSENMRADSPSSFDFTPLDAQLRPLTRTPRADLFLKPKYYLHTTTAPGDKEGSIRANSPLSTGYLAQQRASGRLGRAGYRIHR